MAFLENLGDNKVMDYCNKYEIKVNGEWIEVSLEIFRSSGWNRRLNGEPYNGPLYYLGTDEVVNRESRT